MEWLISRKIAKFIKEKQLTEIQSLLEPYTLKERKRIISQNVNKTSLLYSAIECQNLEIVNYLMDECGANPNDTGCEMGLGCPCLWKAADLNNLKAVQELLEHGADINSSNRLGATALFTACHQGYSHMVSLLLLYRADVNSANHEGVTCLMASVSYPDICSYLVSRGAHVNQISASGDSALTMAIEVMEVETFSVLVKAGADPTIINNRGEDAIFIALNKHFPINLEYFQTAGQLRVENLALASEIEFCRDMIIGDEQLANTHWHRALELRDLPKETPFTQSVNSIQSELGPIRHLLNSRHADVLFFLESRLGIRNAHTLELLKWIIYNTKSLRSYVTLFNFFIKIINSTDNLLFFDMYVHLHPLIVNFVFKNCFEDNFKLAFSRLLNIFDGISDHLENLSTRIHAMNLADRLSKTSLIRLYIYLILNLISSIKYHREENLQKIYKFYSKIVKLDLRGRHNASLLHFCISAQYEPRISLILLSAGADVNAKDDKGRTPAHYALTSPQYCNKKTIDCFLEHGLRFDEMSEENPCLPCVLKKKNLLIYPLRHTSLQCLAANVVAINYDTTKMPLSEIIQTIIYSHTS